MKQGRPPASGAMPVSFTPGIVVDDPVARRWLAEVTLRLRREVAWIWHQRGDLEAAPGLLPPASDPLSEALDLTRYDADRAAFFATDPTARYLSERIAALDQAGDTAPQSGFGWLAARLSLTAADCFVLALALGGAVDSARGAVIAACQNAASASDPTLSLAQRLWDRPDEILMLLDPAHPLAEAGILIPGGWEAALTTPPVIARQLLWPAAAPPAALAPLEVPATLPAAAGSALAAARIAARDQGRPLIVPLSCDADAPVDALAAGIADAAGMKVLMLRGAGDPLPLLLTAWARGAAVLMPAARLQGLLLPALPLVIFAALPNGGKLPEPGRAEILPKVTLDPLDYRSRLALWHEVLPALREAEDGQLLPECARRFALEARAIRRIAAAVSRLEPSRDTLFAACRADLDLGELAQRVTPRFALTALMLPPRQNDQILALIRAVRALGTVHMDWGLGRAWNESGLSVLFTGPPGTGKTMAAEAIAAEVGMPMYRIDLSQVVNKYIGETEKNLRRLFDAADCGDAILFFDEADAIFGKRTEVKDAHDRYANLEVSYLLERMERFRGMAILASNRRKDLDEAFLRRLRSIVSFPLPEAPERLRIWQAMLPEGVECDGLDLALLAERMPLSGGHIRSAIFNACLQSVVPDRKPRLEMGPLLRALKDEFDKLGRTVSLEQFGRWAGELRDGA